MKFALINAKKYIVFRVLPFLLACLMLTTSMPLAVFSVGEDEGNASAGNSSNLVYDYDTLKITLDGDEIKELSIYPHEKIEVSGAGVPENAEYQWQIKHPERNNLWVDIYDATEDSIGVSAALISNMLAEDGTAALRLRAYTEDYAYLSRPVTVTLLDEEQPSPTLSVDTVTFPSALAGETSETPEFVTVTIEYVQYGYVKQDDGSYEIEELGQAFSPYIATLKYGASLNTVVVSPTIVGFTPYFITTDTNGNPTKVDGTNVTIAIDAVTSNIEYTVEYRPALVPYEVHYYFQNIYDDLYVEDTALAPVEYLQGYTGLKPDAAHTEKEFDGFTSLYYIPDTIAADGSTVFEVYYERNYYLMEFDCNGGYGTDTVYVRYGTYISVPDPVRSGYIFEDWDGNGDGVTDVLPNTMPPYNSAYTAIWRTSDTTYTVVYWAENANDSKYSYWGYQIFEAVSAQTRSGVAYGTNTDPIAKDANGNNLQDISQMQGQTDYFTFSADLSDKNKLIEGNGSTIINVYYTRNIYTISFYANGKCAMTEHEHGENGENCTVFICGYSHVHGPECVQGARICGITEHTAHTSPECLKCEKEVHPAHTDACCTKEPHTHTVSCYTATQQTELNIRSNHPNNTNNMVKVSDYLYKQNNTYYLYIGSGTNTNRYYRIDNATDNTQVILTCTWSHTHDNDCFEAYNYSTLSIGSSPYTGTEPDSVSGSENLYYIRTGSYWNGYTYHYYVKAGENYYQIGNSYDEQQDITVSVKDAEHTHGDGNCTCATEIHTHDDSCYDTLHTHTEACYEWSCGADSHVHTAKCCGQTEHTHTDDCTTSKNQIVYYITGKYGQDIKKHFYISGNNTSYIGYWWQVPNGSTFFESGKYIVGIDSIPGENITFTGTDKDYSENTAAVIHYYVEALKGGSYTHEYEGKDGVLRYYNLYKDVHTVRDGYLTVKEEFHDIAGFTNGYSKELFYPSGLFSPSNFGTSVAADNYLYYLRNDYTLRYYNHNDYLRNSSNNEITKTLQFQTLLTDYELTKAYMEANHYPDKLEPGAYEFGGWYTTSQCFPGTEVVWSTDTMPSSDLTVYAKWTPVTRNVYFYYTYDDIGTTNYWETTNNAGERVTYPIVVDHGSLLGTTYNYIPTREGYAFVGWFYIDEDGKKRFAPDSMEVKQDLHLFAEWQSDIDTTYTVNYVLRDNINDAHGNTLYPAGTIIGEETFGHITAGKTKTFAAKARNELLSAFQSYSLFPVTNSHSILMKEDTTQNVYDFEYVVDDEVWYKVKYINKIDGTVLHTEKVQSTGNAIITEKFVPISGYLPEKYYIQKVLASDGTSGNANNVNPDNEIIFYYMPDADHGLFTIIYYKETLVDGVYEQVQSELGSGDVNTTISKTIEPNKFNGFTPAYSTITTYTQNSDKTWTSTTSDKLPYSTTPEPSGTLTAGGLEIRIYYTRNDYPYLIKFVDDKNTVLGYGKLGEDGTVYEIDDVKNAVAPFESKITYTAPQTITKNNIAYILQSVRTQDKEIRVESVPTGGYEKLSTNVLTFVYTQKEITVFYHAVCKIPGMTDFGAVSMNRQTVKNVADIVGSEAMPGSGYQFSGWYTDANCTMKISDNAFFKPGALDTTKDEVHYYALFEPIYTDLKITKNGISTDDGNYSFLFNVKGQGKFDYIDITVTIQGNDADSSVVIKDLPIGEYVVTEITSWSWEYNADNVSTNNTIDVYTIEAASKIEVTLEDKDGQQITFTNTDNNSNWLNGEAVNENQFS